MHRGQRTNISHSETVGREGGDTIFGAKFSIRLFRYYIKFLNKENMHTYSYGVLLYSDGRMPPLVALFADLYQFCTRYVKSNNDLCSADVLTIARNTRQVNTSAEHRSLLLVSCPPFSTYGLGVRYICSLAPVGTWGGWHDGRVQDFEKRVCVWSGVDQHQIFHHLTEFAPYFWKQHHFGAGPP